MLAELRICSRTTMRGGWMGLRAFWSVRSGITQSRWFIHGVSHNTRRDKGVQTPDCAIRTHGNSHRLLRDPAVAPIARGTVANLHPGPGSEPELKVAFLTHKNR